MSGALGGDFPFDSVNESKILYVSGRTNPGYLWQVHDSMGKPLKDITALGTSFFATGGNFYTIPTDRLVKIDGATGETIYDVARAHPAICCNGTYWAGIEINHAGSGLTSTWWVTIYFYSATDGSYIGSLESAHRMYGPLPYYNIQKASIVPSGAGFTVYLWNSFKDDGGYHGWQTGYCTVSGWGTDPVTQARIARAGATTADLCLLTENYTVCFFMVGSGTVYSLMYTPVGSVATTRIDVTMPNLIYTAFVIPGTDTIVFNGYGEYTYVWTGSYRWNVAAANAVLLNADYLVVSPLPSVGGVPYALAIENAPVETSPHEWEYYVMNLNTGAVALFGKSLP